MSREDERYTYLATPNVSGHDWATQDEAMEDLRLALGWERVYLTDYWVGVCYAYRTQERAEKNDAGFKTPLIERF